MRVLLPVLGALVCAGCAGEDESQDQADRLASRRIALGLDEVWPIPFERAMHALEETLEPDLKRAAVGRLDLEASLDTALRIGSALRHADLTTRTGDPEDFGERMRASARLADTWAWAALSGDAQRARSDARALLLSCIDCHKLYRN